MAHSVDWRRRQDGLPGAVPGSTKRLEAVRAATPSFFVVVERVMKDRRSSWQGKRWAEHGTCGKVRLQDRGRVDVSMVAILVFAVPSWRSDSTISSSGSWDT